MRVLDARHFAKDAYHAASDHHGHTLHHSFRRALFLFTSLDSILLDGHADLESSLLVGHGTADPPLLLSIPHWPSPLPATFFNSASLQRLVYLDLSGIPGSVLSLVQPSVLPDLRILKLRGREVDDAALNALATIFRLRLWSLDLTDNRITDAVIATVAAKCFPTASLRADAYCRVEGKLLSSVIGSSEHGPFVTIQESEWSKSFCHPERFFVDAPVYVAEPESGPQENQTLRSGGRGVIVRDTADATIQALSEVDGPFRIHDTRNVHGITHLHVSGNQISALGIAKLLRISNGQLEELSCDHLPLLPPSAYSGLWPKSVKLYGILGAAHLFRPVFSSNLRALKVHHSLVTNIPTLEAEGLSTLARIYLSETSLLSRVEQSYPETFIPDMNPRLYSLTLTGIPRRSSGPVITRLLNFLKFLSVQERAIQIASPVSPSWRRPNMLQGLRHVRLEFEPDPMEDGFSGSEDLNAEELLNTGERSFRFFDERVESLPAEVKLKPSHNEAPDLSADVRTQDIDSDREEDTVTYQGQWNGKSFTVPIWVGPKTSNHIVIERYRRLVVDHGLRHYVGPVTPAQVLAGAPEDSYISHTAWCVAIMPQELMAPPTGKLAGMKDVLVALKQNRLAGRAKRANLKTLPGAEVPLGEPHYFWTGQLEVATEQGISHARPSDYWR